MCPTVLTKPILYADNAVVIGSLGNLLACKYLLLNEKINCFYGIQNKKQKHISNEFGRFWKNGHLLLDFWSWSYIVISHVRSHVEPCKMCASNALSASIHGWAYHGCVCPLCDIENWGGTVQSLRFSLNKSEQTVPSWVFYQWRHVDVILSDSSVWEGSCMSWCDVPQLPSNRNKNMQWEQVQYSSTQLKQFLIEEEFSDILCYVSNWGVLDSVVY